MGEDVHRESGGTMKVSNSINVTSIYQEQLKKLQNAKPGDFSKLMGDKVSERPVDPVYEESEKIASNQQSKVNLADFIKNESTVRTPEEMINFTAQTVANEPDIRFEKVNHIKALVDAGQYNVSPIAVAEKLYASGHVTRTGYFWPKGN